MGFLLGLGPRPGKICKRLPDVHQELKMAQAEMAAHARKEVPPEYAWNAPSVFESDAA